MEKPLVDNLQRSSDNSRLVPNAISADLQASSADVLTRWGEWHQIRSRVRTPCDDSMSIGRESDAEQRLA